MSPLASAATSTGSGFGSLLLLALPLLLIVYLIFSQRRRQRRMATMQAELQVGDDVMTTTGLYARVVSLDDAVVEVEAAPGVVLRWDRRAIVRPPQADAPRDDAPDTEGRE
ncbi:MAG: preprotein translocase subunit YajC [Actinomycetota bacterium]|jgi:preprotein translocase subunit YajC|nr:preprotein translocase subunit YajC [Actinomycetota bacterium]